MSGAIPESALTDPERRVSELLREADVTPTMQEIARALGLASRSTVHRHIDALVRYGFVRRVERNKRGLVVVDRLTAALKSYPTDALVSELASRGISVPFHADGVAHA